MIQIVLNQLHETSKKVWTYSELGHFTEGTLNSLNQSHKISIANGESTTTEFRFGFALNQDQFNIQFLQDNYHFSFTKSQCLALLHSRSSLLQLSEFQFYTYYFDQSVMPRIRYLLQERWMETTLRGNITQQFFTEVSWFGPVSTGIWQQSIRFNFQIPF